MNVRMARATASGLSAPVTRAIGVALTSASLAACVPMALSYYVPTSGGEIVRPCNWPTVFVRSSVTDGVDLQVDFSSGRGIGLLGLQVRIAGAQKVRLAGSTLEVSSAELSQSIVIPIEPFRRGAARIPPTAELTGPGHYSSYFKDAANPRPKKITVAFPQVEVDGRILSAPPVQLDLHEEWTVVGVACT
jgi:hypothetical protein